MLERKYIYEGRVVRVVDGDTIDVVIDLGFHISVQLRLRLLGVDTPEIYHPGSRAEYLHGKRAKEFVESLVLGTTVVIETKKTGKYGRWLAVVQLPDGSTLQEHIIAEEMTKRDHYEDDE